MLEIVTVPGVSVMINCATYDDVNLVLRLYELRRETRLREARTWMMKKFHADTVKEFRKLCPEGSQEDASFRMVVSYWDMACSFVVAGVLQKELFFESNREMLVVWERVKNLVPELREQFKDPKLFFNLEQTAEWYVAWVRQRGEGCYEAFSERVRGG